MCQRVNVKNVGEMDGKCQIQMWQKEEGNVFWRKLDGNGKGQIATAQFMLVKYKLDKYFHHKWKRMAQKLGWG